MCGKVESFCHHFRIGEIIGVLKRKFGALKNDGKVNVFACMGDLQVRNYSTERGYKLEPN